MATCCARTGASTSLYRIWPGTQRLLLWARPGVRGRRTRARSSSAESCGVEVMEPLSFKGRKGRALPGARTAAMPMRALKPQLGLGEVSDTYRVWGRSSTTPMRSPMSGSALLRTQFGAAAPDAENALAAASRILPIVTTAHMPSAANNNYWPEIYTNMSMVDPRIRSRTATRRRRRSSAM